MLQPAVGFDGIALGFNVADVLVEVILKLEVTYVCWRR
jgi:tetrahydromethanopterin S-methyltransferase subunit F